MQVTLAVLADYANVSQEGKLNVLGIFDQIRTPALPALHPQAHIVVRVQVTRIEFGRAFPFRLVCIDEDGKELFGIDGDMNIPEQEGALSITLHEIIRLNNLVFEKPGDHAVIMAINGEERARIPFRVSIIPLPNEDDGSHDIR